MFGSLGVVFKEKLVFKKDQVAALARSHLNGLIPFEKAIEQMKETMPLALKQ